MESDKNMLLSESTHSNKMVATYSKRERNLYKMLYLNINTRHQWQRKHIKRQWLKKIQLNEIWSSLNDVPEDSSILFRNARNCSPVTQRHTEEYFRFQIKCKKKEKIHISGRPEGCYPVQPSLYSEIRTEWQGFDSQLQKGYLFLPLLPRRFWNRLLDSHWQHIHGWKTATA